MILLYPALLLTVLQAKPFRLLDLPPELWSRICSEVIMSESPTELDDSLKRYQFEEKVAQPAITRVCKIVREEALPMFYSSSFVYVDCGNGAQWLFRWLKKMREGGIGEGLLLAGLVVESAFSDGEKYFVRELQRVGWEMEEDSETKGLVKGLKRWRVKVKD